MIEIASFIAQNPNAALSFVAILVACFFAYLLYRQWESKSKSLQENYEQSETRFNIRSASLEKSMQETRNDLNKHRDDLGRASKAIAGDLLKTKEKIFELKEELVKQLDDLRKNSSEMQRSMVLASETAKIAIENINEKLGRVIIIEQKMTQFEQYVTKLQQADGENHQEIIKHRTWFKQIGESLASQKARLEAIERENKGGK